MKPKQQLTLHKVFTTRNDRPSISTSYKKIVARDNLLSLIEHHTSFLLSTASLYERLFCILHDITEQPTCKHCNAPIKFSEGKKHYASFCRSCSQKDPNVREKYYQKMEEKYGERYTSRNSTIKEKIQQTMMSRYGVKSYTQTRDIIEKSKTNKQESVQHALNLVDNVEWLIDQNRKKSLLQIAGETNVSPSFLQKRYAKHGIEVKQHYQSQQEKEVQQFLRELNIETQTRVKRFGPEIDIFLPEFNLGIEIDGTFWHSELNGKHRNYHKEKTDMLEKHKVRLIHVFDTEWVLKTDIVRSRITSLLGKNTTKIYARECDIVEISSKQRKLFFQNTHIQGDVPASKTYGLVHKGNVICMMSFGSSRYSKHDYELLRFSCQLNTTVVGGASKLFKHFVKKQDPASVISYSDKRYNTGKVYKNLGFSYSHTSSPNYWYFHRNRPYELFSRTKFQKHKLVKILSDYVPEISEWENMKRNQYDRIWDCGNDVWVWNR